MVKPDGTKFASFFDKFKMFRIYNNSGVLEKEVIMMINEDIFDPKRKRGTSMIYYRVVKVSNKYIYAMCMNEYSDKLLETNPSIEIWDWDGNPVAKLNMNNPIFTFDVTMDDKKLYCIDRVEIDKIFVYNLETVLK